MSHMIARYCAELRLRLEDPMSLLERRIQAVRGDDAANALMAQRIRLSGKLMMLQRLFDLLGEVQGDRTLWALLDDQPAPVHEPFHCHVRVRQPSEPDVRQHVVDDVSQSFHSEPPRAA